MTFAVGKDNLKGDTRSFVYKVWKKNFELLVLKTEIQWSFVPMKCYSYSFFNYFILKGRQKTENEREKEKQNKLFSICWLKYPSACFSQGWLSRADAVSLALKLRLSMCVLAESESHFMVFCLPGYALVEAGTWGRRHPKNQLFHQMSTLPIVWTQNSVIHK